MIQYKVCLNNGNEALGIDQKTVTANEDVKTCDEQALAREIAHENPLIPEQVAKAVLENFCKAAAIILGIVFAVFGRGFACCPFSKLDRQLASPPA